MKTKIAISSLMILLSAVFQACASIIAGPITNPANGHDYYLLTPNTWTASETEAENLGGTLAIIRNAHEQKWVFSTFGDYGGTNRNLWIGLHRQWQGSPLVWVTGEQLDYSNWASGQPDNAGRVENCVEMWANGTWDGHGFWNDWVDVNFCYGLVEVEGKSNEQSLTENEKSLIGNWYEGGNPENPCYITGTKNMLFAVNHGRAGRIFSTPKGDIFLSSWNSYGEILKDKILWSNGTWWSRTPAKYATSGTAEKAVPQFRGGIIPD